MTSPIKLENQQNRQYNAQQHHHNNHHGSFARNLHLSEVITTGTGISNPHHNGIGLRQQSGVVDPIEMNKLLNNITTSMNLPSKPVSTSSNMDYSSRLHHFSWEEIEGRYLPVIFRNENGCLQRYTSKMFVENTLFQSESWQRYASLARSLPPLISFPYTENELKLFRLIVEWHLASFHFKTILPSDCLIRYDDLLEFYGALRKLRDSMAVNGFNRPLVATQQFPTSLSMLPPKQRPSTSTNGLSQSFQLPTMGSNNAIKPHAHSARSQPPAKLYTTTPLPPPSALHHSHPPNYLIQPNNDLLVPFTTAPSTLPYNYNAIPPSKTNIPPSSVQWTDPASKINDRARLTVPKPMMSTNISFHEELNSREKNSSVNKSSHPPKEQTPVPRETKESGWVQINNVFVPYVIKMKLRESDLEKCSTRQAPPQLQREFFVPYEILIKCHIFSDQDFAFKKFLIKANQQDFDVFNSLITNINIFDEKTPEKTPLVNLYHVMIGLQKVIYVKLLTTKQPRTQVNKYHADVLAHKGGTLLMSANKLVPYILQNNRFYVPLMFAYQSIPHVLSQAKRGARAPRQYEIDYLNLLILYFNIDSLPLTSDTLLVDVYGIKCPNYQPPVHFRTLAEHQQYERNRLLNTLSRTSQVTNKTSNKIPTTSNKSNVNASNHKPNKCPPANVVVNPLIHHPSFYGHNPTNATTKAVSSPSTSSLTNPSNSNSVIVNPLLLPAPETSDKQAPISVHYPLIKSIKYDQHQLNAVVKSIETNSKDWKIAIRHIFEEFAFDIDYQKFIQWCQANQLLPLTTIQSDEKQISRYDNYDDFFVLQRHLDRCIALLNDLKRGTISMTLLPSSNTDHQSAFNLVRSPLAGAKKRKTTIPTTRLIQSTSDPSVSVDNIDETSSSTISNDQQQSMEIQITNESNTEETSPTNVEKLDDEAMPIVDTVEEELCEPVREADPSFLIVDSNEGDDTKIQLDDTLPSCSSGYESAPALNNVDSSVPHPSSSDDENEDDESKSTIRSREYSSSCQSEQSFVPILSSVSSNIQNHGSDEDDDDNQTNAQKLQTTVSLMSDDNTIIGHQTRQRDKQGKFAPRSRSPTPRSIKKKRSSDELISLPNTITSDQIEQHLRTLAMPGNEQRRVRKRPIKTPTRLVEEISAQYSMKILESDSNVFESISATIDQSTSNDDSTLNKNNNVDSPTNSQQSCTYNVTISNKPNKLGLTIKKVLPR